MKKTGCLATKNAFVCEQTTTVLMVEHNLCLLANAIAICLKQ